MPHRTNLTTTEYAVLGLLADAGELSGYDLRKRAERSVGYFWSPARSQIYAVLPRLVAGGYATRRKVAQSERPDKQLYRVTEAGVAALREWLDAGSVEPPPDCNPLLLKVFFGEHAAPDALLEQVRERRREAEALRADLERIDASAGGRSKDFFPALTRRYGLEYADAIIRWSDGVERELTRRRRRAASAPR